MYVRFKKDEKHIEFKDGDERNETSHDLSVFDDAGYILTDDDIIVDIDNLPQDTVKVLIETFNINTETVWSNSGEKEGHNGVHLYFKKPDGYTPPTKQGVCALGFQVEYKFRPSAKYVTVKRHGNARRVDNPGIREELPEFLKPRAKGTYKNMFSLDEGEGRNDALFTHKATIMTITIWRKILNFINDYIFNDPLPKSEMNHLLREQDLVATKDNQYEMATAMIQDLNIVKYNQTIFFRHGRVYKSDGDLLERLIWARCEGMNSHYVREIKAQIEGRARLIHKDTEFPIKFDNGILKRGEFLKMEYDDFTPYHIEIDYKPDAKPVKAVDDYLDHLTGGDPDYRLYIGEVLGHILIKEPELKRMIGHVFFFIGGGGNGKGTLLEIIRRIVQPQNTSQLDIRQLTDERYLVSINNKLVNLGDDVEDKTIDHSEIKIIKNLATADVIQMRKLYEESSSVQPTATLIFTTNHIIKTFEKGDSVDRRFQWCPMYTKVKKKDPKFITNITIDEALEYWVRLMIEGYFRLYENGKMTPNDPVMKETNKYKIENNLSQLFVEDLELDDVKYIKPKEVYERYQKWCENEGTSPTSARIFDRNVMEHFGLVKAVKRLDGTNHRVYVPEDETDQ